MLSKLNINTTITISQLNNQNLIISSATQTLIIDQPQMLNIILLLLEAPLDMMQLIDKLADKYPELLLLRALNTLKQYQIVIAGEQISDFVLHQQFAQMPLHPFTDTTLKLSDFEQNNLADHWPVNVNGVDADGFPVILVEDFLDPRLAALQQTKFVAKQPFIIAQACGRELLVSPVIDPFNSPCWTCMAYRLKLHRPTQTLHQSAKPLKTATAVFYPEAINAINHALNEQIRQTRDHAHQHQHRQYRLIKLDLTGGETSHHRVGRRPQCPCCGDPGIKTDYNKLALFADNSEITHGSGGYRTVGAEQTYANYRHLIDPLTGIMASVDEYRKVPEAPIYNYCSGRNIALQSRSMFWLNNHMRSSSGGKGSNPQQAKTGALCESIERYSMVWHEQQPCISASYAELANQAIHPNACMNFSQRQIAQRDAINRQSSAFHTLVPISFDENAQRDWSITYSLIEKKEYYLPSSFCFAQYPATDENKLIAYPDSNGCAAGNTHAEAILQGTLELIERDAAAIWWYNRIARPAVDLTQPGNGYIQQMREYYQSINRSLYVLDITTDLAVPCFVAVSFNQLTTKEILYGFGCHLDARLAIERAVIELNQLLPIVLTPRPANFDAGMAAWLDHQEIDSHPYLLPLPEQQHLVDHRHTMQEQADLNVAVAQVIECFKSANIDLLMLDLTQADIAMPVVKMIAPGLRHFWRRLAAGRLYDVPVKMGWRQSPLSESEVNPISIVI